VNATFVLKRTIFFCEKHDYPIIKGWLASLLMNNSEIMNHVGLDSEIKNKQGDQNLDAPKQ